MNKSESNQEPENMKYCKKHFKRLCKSAKANDCGKEWNSWRKSHRSNDVLLDKANLKKLDLRGFDLNGGEHEGDDGQLVDQGEVYLRGAKFYKTKLENAKLRCVHLENAWFYYTYLQGVEFQGATVNSYTHIWKCHVNQETGFRGVALDSIRIDPHTKQLLEYNIRRKNWKDWYEEHPKLKWVVKAFWSISDYGISTKNIISTFFSLAVIFAGIYFTCGAFDYFIFENKATPGIVSHLFVSAELESQVHPICYSFMVFFRAIYFSVVTMTTLGFGDMYANAKNGWWLAWIVGHLLLILQVILGYVLLGALVTRFAVLFTAGGPAGKFADEENKDKKMDSASGAE